MRLFTLFFVMFWSFTVLQGQDDYSIRVTDPEIIQAVFHGESMPLRDYVPDPNAKNERVRAEKLGYVPKHDWPLHESVNPNALPQGPDPAWQKSYTPPGAKSSTIIQNFDGLGYTFVNPADPVMDVGPNHVIQMINAPSGAQFQIWDKSGTSLLGPLFMDNFFNTFGSGAFGLGDPIVLYDQLADRWFMAEFASGSNNIYIMVSTTADPLGTWYAYTFTAPNFPDYLKFSIWPNVYTMTSNELGPSAIYAFDRMNMLAGNPATMQRFVVPDYPTIGFQATTPVGVEGPTAPPVGNNAYFMRMADDAWSASIPADRLEIYDLDVDFVTPTNSVFSGPTNLTTDPFDTELCGYTSFSCMNQPSGSNNLDPLREVLMFKVQYRNFGTHESIVCNHVTDVDNTDRGGVRWYELRRTGGGPWSIYQQGTYSPDADDRWMGAININANGQIGLMFNRSSSTTFPSIYYTGRQPSDPLGTMTEPETVVVAGSASNGSIRYGDYNSLSVDPSDECTFWGTAMYNPTTQWGTRIVGFKLDDLSCAPPNAVCTNVTVELNAGGMASTTAAVVGAGSTAACGLMSEMLDISSFTCAELGDNTVTYTITDINNASSVCKATVTVEDNIDPTIDCPGNETISTDAGQCSATYTVAQPAVDDNCGVTIQRYRYRPVDENCDNIPGMSWSGWTTDATQTLAVGKWKIQWEARDAAINRDRCSFCVTVEDSEPPVANCANITVEVDASGGVYVEPDDIDAGSTDNCGIVSKTINGFDEVLLLCANVGADNTAQLRVFDTGGDSHTCLSSITVEDNIDPEVRCNGLGFTTPNDPDLCTANIDLPVPPATDNCDVETLEYRYRPVDENNQNIGSWMVGWTDEALNNVTLEVGRYRIRWRATDPSGNTDFCNYIVEVEDVEPPTIDCFNQNIVFNGEESIDLVVSELAEASDNCEITSLTLDINEVFCEQLGDEITVTATAVDENGLMNSCTSTVTVDGLPCGWSDQPIGCDGDTSYDIPTETFSLSSDDCHNAITNETDEYAFAAYNLCGNGSITAHVTSINGTSNGWAGVMMRENVDPLAKSVAMSTNLSSNHRREVRYTTGGNITSQLKPAFNRHWLRITRTGNSFRIYASSNGSSWFLRSSQTVAMQECIEVGLVLNGYLGSNEITATFEDVVVIGTTFFELQASPPAELVRSQKTFTVYPNPTTGQVTVALDDFLEQEARLEVLDVNGRVVQLVREGILENSTEQLNLEQLPAGLYFIRLESADGTVQMQRVVLEPRP